MTEYDNCQNCQLNDRVVLLEVRVEEVQKDVSQIYHYLNGNGQPGLADRINARFERMESKIMRIMLYLAILSAGGPELFKLFFGG